jgi:Sulfate permease family
VRRPDLRLACSPKARSYPALAGQIQEADAQIRWDKVSGGGAIERADCDGSFRHWPQIPRVVCDQPFGYRGDAMSYSILKLERWEQRSPGRSRSGAWATRQRPTSAASAPQLRWASECLAELPAVFGSSRHLVVAADSATAAIFASSLSRMAEPTSAHYMTLAGMVALLTAGLLVLARIFKLGFLADFLSRTALIGFFTGVGVQVGTAMLGDMAGVAVASWRTLVLFWRVFEGLPSLNPNRLGFSLLVVASILLGKKFAPKFPVSLIVVVGAIAASNWFHLSVHGFSVIGPVQGLMRFRQGQRHHAL